MMYCVYLLKCNTLGGNTFYIGCTGNLERRIGEHKAGEVKTTKNREPKLIYFEAYNSKKLAFQRERGLKTSGSVYNALLRRLNLK